MMRGAEGMRLQVGGWLDSWHSQWVRQRGEPGIRPGRAVKREAPMCGLQGEGAVGFVTGRTGSDMGEGAQDQPCHRVPGLGLLTGLACPDQSSPPGGETNRHPSACPPPFLPWPSTGPRNSPAIPSCCHRPGPVLSLLCALRPPLARCSVPLQVRVGVARGTEAVFSCVLRIENLKPSKHPGPSRPLSNLCTGQTAPFLGKSASGQKVNSSFKGIFLTWPATTAPVQGALILGCLHWFSLRFLLL